MKTVPLHPCLRPVQAYSDMANGVSGYCTYGYESYPVLCIVCLYVPVCVCRGGGGGGLSVYLSVFLSFCLSIDVRICMYVCACACMFVSVVCAYAGVRNSLLAGEYADEVEHEIEGTGEKRYFAPRKGRLNALNQVQSRVFL